MRGNKLAWALAITMVMTIIAPGVASDETEEIVTREISNILKEQQIPDAGSLGFEIPDMERSDIDIPSISHMNAISGLAPGRASDQEREVDAHDLANGTRIDTTGETITGSLEYIDSGGSDWVDWYKISQPDIDPTGNSASGPVNITISMTTFLDGNMGHDDLYELRVVETSPGVFDLENDYYDLVKVHVEYYNPWVGLVEMGGTEFLYDDQDDSDSWEHDGNWTFHFKTPVPSTGPEDLDGFTNGLEEVGWYYIRFDLSWMQKTGAATRSSFKVNYEFDIEVGDNEVTDDGSNTIGSALAYESSHERSLHTQRDNVDWYRFVGDDPDKIWQTDYSIERTWGSAGVFPDFDGATTGTILDSIMHVWVILPSPGIDEIWGNEDDGWSLGTYVAFTYYLTGNNMITGSRYFNFTYTSRDIDNPDRGLYIGTLIEPVTATYDDTTITGFQYNFWSTYARYKISIIDKVEESVNTMPVLSDLTYSSNNPFNNQGGSLDDDFTFQVTYVDADGDEPATLDLFIDPLGNNREEFSMLGTHDGGDVKTGRVYTLVLEGDDIGKHEGPLDIMMNASDEIPDGSLRLSQRSVNLSLNDTLRIWDDDPVILSSIIDDVPDMMEDGPMIYLAMESMNGGPFHDAERDLRGVMVWNSTDEAYSGDEDTELINVNMTYRDGDGWYARIVPKADMHGEAILSFFGYDEHSYLVWNTTITIHSENDPPMIDGFELNGEEMTLDSTDPLEIEVDLRSESIKEDEEFTFSISAYDTDPEDDRTPITYEFLSAGPSAWSNDPVINRDTGFVTYTPTNSDVRTNGWMMFRVSDGTDHVDLQVKLDITNAPDSPSIDLNDPVTIVAQGEEWDIRPFVDDIDRGDSHTYSINLEESIDDELDPITDQIPFATLGEDLITSFNPDTGRFTLSAIGDDVWRGDGELFEQVTLNIVIRVLDLGGLTDLVYVNVTLLKSDPWIPDTPEATVEAEDDYPEQIGIQALEVSASCNEYDTSLYGAGWVYRWDFGDGTVLEGREASHTYSDYGTKTIRLTLSSGEYSSTTVTKEITLVEPEIKENPDPDDDPPIMVYLLVIGIVLLVIIGLIVFFMMRRGGGEQDDITPIEDTTHGRPHRPERSAPESVQRSSSRDEDDSSTTCPSCGATVKKGWFLCPECKHTLAW